MALIYNLLSALADPDCIVFSSLNNFLFASSHPIKEIGMFSCIETDSDSDEDGGAAARYTSGTNIGHMLPAPELVDDHASSVHSIAISHFGDIISGGCGEIYINRYGEFEETSDIKGIICGFEPIYALAVIYGVEPKFISAHGDGLLRTWNLLSRTPLLSTKAHSGPILGLSVLQGAEPVIITGGVDRFVKFHDPDLNLLAQLPEQGDSVTALDACWQGEGSVIVTGLGDGSMTMWMFSPPETFMKIRDILRCDVAIRAVTMSSALFAVGKYDGGIDIRHIRTGELKFSLEGHLDVVRSLVIQETSDTCILVSGSWDGTVCIWDLNAGMRVQVLRGHTDDVTAVAISGGAVPFVVSGSKDWSVRVWDISNVKGAKA